MAFVSAIIRSGSLVMCPFYKVALSFWVDMSNGYRGKKSLPWLRYVYYPCSLKRRDAKSRAFVDNTIITSSLLQFPLSLPIISLSYSMRLRVHSPQYDIHDLKNSPPSQSVHSSSSSSLLCPLPLTRPQPLISMSLSIIMNPPPLLPFNGGQSVSWSWANKWN